MAPGEAPYVIRLRGPWQLSQEAAKSATQVQSACDSAREVRLPIQAKACLPERFCGRLEMRRKFNWPEPLDYCEALWVVVRSAAWPWLLARLNGEPLGTLAGSDQLPAGWEITSRVKPSNELTLTWELDAQAAVADASWLDVQLEVRRPATGQDRGGDACVGGQGEA
jgi:hypothetical protein